MKLRVQVARAFSVLVIVPLALLSGTGLGGSDERPMSNGLLVLASRGDLRSDGGRRLARRLDTSTWVAYLFGLRVLIDWDRDPRRLLDARKGVVGEIEVVNGTKDLYRCRLDGGSSTMCVIVPRRQRDERRAGPFARG